MKDSWRVDVPDIWADGQIYKSLKEAGVHHILNCLSSGDILTDQYHATKTCEYVYKPWACYFITCFVPHRHHHLTLDVIGRFLMTFKCSHEMVSVVRDAVIGNIL